jgi:hypothetical protein
MAQIIKRPKQIPGPNSLKPGDRQVSEAARGGASEGRARPVTYTLNRNTNLNSTHLMRPAR